MGDERHPTDLVAAAADAENADRSAIERREREPKSVAAAALPDPKQRPGGQQLKSREQELRRRRRWRHVSGMLAELRQVR